MLRLCNPVLLSSETKGSLWRILDYRAIYTRFVSSAKISTRQQCSRFLPIVNRRCSRNSRETLEFRNGATMSMGRRSLSRENSYFIFGDVANKARANSFVREEECHRKKRGGVWRVRWWYEGEAGGGNAIKNFSFSKHKRISRTNHIKVSYFPTSHLTRISNCSTSVYNDVNAVMLRILENNCIWVGT